MLSLAGKSRSSQIVTAAHLLTASWILSVALWWWVASDLRNTGLAAVDLCLAIVFYVMARGKRFPAPLCFLHAGLVIYYLYVTWIGASYAWIAAFTNRSFELELFYVAACAVFRITRLARNE